MTNRRHVLLVGLGTIARTHAAVLSRRDDVQIVGGVDPRSRGEGYPFPLWTSLEEALAAEPRPDIVVIATPTDTHIDIAHQVLDRTDAVVLCEKPLARTAAQIASLEAALSPDVVADRLKVAHHFGFSPEVEWAHGVVRAHPEWGPPSIAMSVFNDAYAELPRLQLDSYVSSWVDSGPNQLSLLSMFITGWEIDSHMSSRERSLTSLRHDGGTTLLATNWVAGDTSKQTTLEFLGGAITLRIDHTSMTGLLLEGGRPVEHVGYAGSVSRKEAHYRGLYRTLLADPTDVRLGVPMARTIEAVLHDADALASPTGPVTLSSISAAD